MSFFDYSSMFFLVRLRNMSILEPEWAKLYLGVKTDESRAPNICQHSEYLFYQIMRSCIRSQKLISGRRTKDTAT